MLGIVLLALLQLAACGVIGTARDLTSAQKFIADIKIPPSDLSLVGWADHKSAAYDTGDKITLSVWVNQEAYVAVLRVLPSGKTTVLFPNKIQPKARVSASQTVQIPAPGDHYEIVAGNKGPELIEFFASTNGSSWLFTRKPEGSAIFVELGSTTKELAKDLVAALQGKGEKTGGKNEKAEAKSAGKPLAAGQSLILAID